MVYDIKIRNKIYTVEVEDNLSRILSCTPDDSFESQIVANIPDLFVDDDDADETSVCSSMPGTVISVNVHSGDAVKKNDVLIIIESMKMENYVCAPCDGIVQQVIVSKGDRVSLAQQLVTFSASAEESRQAEA